MAESEAVWARIAALKLEIKAETRIALDLYMALVAALKREKTGE